MHEFLDEGEQPPAERRPDTELTLGPVLLLGLFFGLVLLCGLCFGLGYSMGSRGASATVQQPGALASPQPAGSPPKPSADVQNISRPALPAVADLPSSAASGANPDAGSSLPGATSAGGANPAPPVVKPALPATATAPSQAPTPASAQPAFALKAQAAGAQMVQIAAVAHQEDADVLVAALRKRGFAVTARRDPADNQIHVRIGPFSNRNDANAMRQKLLSDGYNAIVQP